MQQCNQRKAVIFKVDSHTAPLLLRSPVPTIVIRRQPLMNRRGILVVPAESQLLRTNKLPSSIAQNNNVIFDLVAIEILLNTASRRGND